MGLNMVRRLSVTWVLACAPFLCSCNFLHDGRKAFLASQKEAKQTKHFMVELDEPAQMAHVKRSQALDCDARYFHEHEVLERTPQGIETGASLSQGRPSSHQESETLFVGGKTYGKNTGSWENASSDDASPDWHPVSLSRDPSDECRAMARGISLGYLSYEAILQEGHIEYLGRQRVNGHQCLEYDVKFASQVLKEMRVCLGSSDDLPYRVAREDYTAAFSYEPVARLPVPEQAASPSTP